MIATFFDKKINYNRSIQATSKIGVCLFCGEKKEVLSTDNSDEEYISCDICKDCIDKVFNN
jgi:hypothetical protein